MKKIQFPKIDFRFAFGPASFVGIDIGSDSVKVVQLRKERERAVLETYGELKTGHYFQTESGRPAGGIIAHLDKNVADLLTDVMREANVTSRRAVFAIPSTSSFLTVASFPFLKRDEISSAVPFEAKRYIPIPVSEVALDWQIIEEDEAAKRIDVLLVAVPHEVIAKYQRIAEAVGFNLEAVEIESFALVRSLLASGERGVSAIIAWGALATTIIIADRRVIRMNHNFGRGSQEITLALSRGLGISGERAEEMKREVGLSEKPEERGIAEVIAPHIDSTLSDLERMMMAYNRTTERKIEKIVLAGGGANLKGLVDHVSRRFGLETALANPFGRTIFPAFLAPMLKEIGPNFAAAVGLALRQIT